jgi:diadenosine tetraphosphate (Ap4A) HIT family hydrolase
LTETLIHRQVAAARAGNEPSVICRMPAGWAVLANMQFLKGYSLLLPDPVVGSINDLNRQNRSEYLYNMTIIGDALLEVTGAYRINYAIMGNSDPALHAHIVPRYLSEPDEQRRGQPWSYSQEFIDSRRFDYDLDKDLIQQIARAIKKRL